MWFRKLARKRAIFLDYAAGRDNPSAIYNEGRNAKERLEQARKNISHVLHIQARDVIFTSGGTESDNLAVLGVYEASRQARDKQAPHIIISDVEHPAVREAALEAKRRGAEVTELATEPGGVVNIETLKKALQPNTMLVSIMYVNNQTGAINQISHISRLMQVERKSRGNVYPLLHSDASQAAGFLSLDVSALGVDLMTLDTSKVSTTKGTGLLVVRPHVPLKSILFGGEQERGLRPGTENVQAIVQFSDKLIEKNQNREAALQRLKKLKATFLEELVKLAPQTVVNSPRESVPNIVSISIPGALHEFVAIKLAEHGVYVSTGSSCSTYARQDENEALRFSFGETTSEGDVREAVRILSKVI